MKKERRKKIEFLSVKKIDLCRNLVLNLPFFRYLRIYPTSIPTRQKQRRRALGRYRGSPWRRRTLPCLAPCRRPWLRPPMESTTAAEAAVDATIWLAGAGAIAARRRWRCWIHCRHASQKWRPARCAPPSYPSAERCRRCERVGCRRGCVRARCISRGCSAKIWRRRAALDCRPPLHDHGE